MARIQKGEHRGKEFSSEYQPKNRRKPKIFNALKKRYGLDVDLKSALEDFSREQVEDLLRAVLYVDPRETAILNKKLNAELKGISEALNKGDEPEAIKKDEKLWQIFTCINTAIQRETAAGKSDTVRWILEDLLGKATQPIEGELTNTNIQANQDLSALSTEELNTYLELQRKIQAGNV